MTPVRRVGSGGWQERHRAAFDCIRRMSLKGYEGRGKILRYRAMRRAISRLSPAPELVLVDGWPIPDSDVECRGVTGGDRLSLSIACASILAKVHRDDIMQRLGRRYPD